MNMSVSLAHHGFRFCLESI